MSFFLTLAQMLCLKCYYIFEDYNIHIYTYIYTRLPHIHRKPVSIWCDHHLPHAVQHISFAYIWSGCWLWPVEYWSTPLQWLCEVAGYWQKLENAVVYADPKHPKYAQWVTCPVSMLAMQELGCVQLPGIVYRSLQHGAMHYHAATWGDGRGWMAQQWASGSRHGISVHSKCHQ